LRAFLDLLDFLTPYGTHSLIVIFGILLACGFGLPMPEDIILITAGILASHNVFDQMSAHIVCFAGVIIGDGIIYLMGLKLGPQLKRRGPFKKLLTPERDARVTEVFRKYGTKVIFMARFMPGLRMPIFLTSGIFQVKWWVFFGLDGFAALISVPLWVHLGYVFGTNLEQLEKMTRRFQVGIYSLLGLVIVTFLILWFIRKRREKGRQNQYSGSDPSLVDRGT
jgi:membrane protein DedA with SNARE-associated domain